VVWKLGGRDGQYEPRDTGLQVHPDAAGREAFREGWKQTVPDGTSTTDTLRKVIAAISTR
jgi:hypothetical protein